MNTLTASQKQQIRSRIQDKRTHLSDSQQLRASTDCAKIILQSSHLTTTNKIALYLQNDGELNPKPLIEALWQQGKSIYLPVIKENTINSLRFAPYTPTSPMKENKFGIAEPTSGESCPIDSLDVIFLPLVAFDNSGQRLGMGGGYYDRTLAAHKKAHYRKIGLAYEFQRVDKLPSESWDQTLDLIITEKKIYQPNH